jgi:hypothetical protein
MRVTVSFPDLYMEILSEKPHWQIKLFSTSAPATTDSEGSTTDDETEGPWRKLKIDPS